MLLKRLNIEFKDITNYPKYQMPEGYTPVDPLNFEITLRTWGLGLSKVNNVLKVVFMHYKHWAHSLR